HHAVVDRFAVRRFHAHFHRRRLLEHGAGHRTELAHALQIVADGARTVGVLVAVFLVAYRLLHLDPAPVGLQLVGYDLRDTGADALPHLGAVADHGDGALAIDRDEHVRHQDSGRHLGALRRLRGGNEAVERAHLGNRVERHAEHETARAGGHLEELTTVDFVDRIHGYTPAASLIAWRIRVYVPQRQMLPCIAASMSSSLGFGFCFRNAAACMI